MSVVIETTQGDITVDLYTKDRPKSSLNFLKLCKTKRYNLNLFHMVQNNFIAQTGDPTGSGRGGESIFLELYGEQARFFEAESVPRIKHTKRGLISMVNCGEGMIGSQFFLTLGDELTYLDGEHCVFGEVVEGWDTLDKINSAICDTENKPYQDIRITHTVILHDPFDDPAGLPLREESPVPSKEMLASSRIGADEDINDYQGKTEEEINEIIADKEAKARATILEMVGDLPDAEVAPPENVLFVCKLNPVTNDDDLEIIFSRFGKVKCCEVIRDHKTKESLQYAFVEFEDQSACEQAYFKMDNVLIDDRRIHVDFSQSVSKYRWKGKGRLEVMDDKGQRRKEDGGRSRRERSPDKKKPVPGWKLRQMEIQQQKDKEKERLEKRFQQSGSRSASGESDDSRGSSPDRRAGSPKTTMKEKPHHANGHKRSPSEPRNDRERPRDRMEKSKKPKKDRDRSRGRDESRDRHRDRDRSRERRRDRSRDRERERSRERQRERSRDRHRDRSRDRKRDRSQEKKRKDRSRSRDKSSKKKGRSRSRSRDRRKDYRR